ncbi:MAG TPA: hypothetical protein VKU84_09480 [Stellaceae bacterium]|nr:hypothetical protein [Stellaceae bacterium]
MLHPGLVFAALFVLCALPLSLGAILPLVDYPNHLARMYLLANLPSSPTLQAFYAIDWHPLPNLGMDAVVPTLSRVVPLVWAGKIFVLLTFLLLAGGVAALHRALFGRWTLWPCLAFLLLYNRVLLWGFLNYLFGIGLALCGVAVWIALRERHPAMRVLLGAVFALATYFAHLAAYGVLGLLIFGYEAGVLWRRRASAAECALALALAGLPFLPALAFLGESAASLSGKISFGSPWRKLDMPFSIFDNYSRPFDVACFVIAIGGLAIAFRRRWIKLAPSMVLPLLLLALAFLAMPSQLFTASGADHRLPLVLALVVVAATSWVGPGPGTELRFLACAGLLFLLRLGVVASSWHASERDYGEVLAALDGIPVGSRIAVAYPGTAVHAGGTPLVHLPVWAIAQRQAFVSTLLASPAQQPVVFQPPYRELAELLPPGRLWNAFMGGAPLDAAQRAALERCDFVVFTNAKPFRLAGTDGLEPAYSEPRLQLYRLTHQSEGASSVKGPTF